ncbi:MAG: AAA family ATPase [Candidatus Anammoxibacter sp.]
MTDHALFYFRDPAFIDTLPPDRRIHFQEVPVEEEIKKLGRKEAALRAKERKEKLKLLKERIEESKLPVKRYPDPKALGELVLKELTEIINTLFPEERLPDPLDREAAEHEAFLQSRTRVYIMGEERKKRYLKRLNDHARGAGPPLTVLGESGSGKSALLANWVQEYSESHKEAFIITHFIGASPYSADWALMLRRIMGELKRRFKIEQEIPDKPDALRSAFANWLHMAAERGRIIIISMR